jgi:hypothetical protein
MILNQNIYNLKNKINKINKEINILEKNLLKYNKLNSEAKNIIRNKIHRNIIIYNNDTKINTYNKEQIDYAIDNIIDKITLEEGIIIANKIGLFIDFYNDFNNLTLMRKFNGNLFYSEYQILIDFLYEMERYKNNNIL